MPYVTVRDEVKRHNYQETAFCNSLIPYYLQVDTKDKSERAKFFRAANILLFDRFPIETAGLTAVAARAAKSKAKRSFAMRVMVSALFLERSLVYTPSEHWTKSMTLRADRERRVYSINYAAPSFTNTTTQRKEWMTIGGVPRHHQYMIAWAPFVVFSPISDKSGPHALAFRASKSLPGSIASVLNSLLKRLEWAQDNVAPVPRPSIHHHTDFKLGPSGFQIKRSTYHVDSPMAPPRAPAPLPHETLQEDTQPFPQLIDPSDPIFNEDVVLDVLSLERQRRRTAGNEICLCRSFCVSKPQIPVYAQIAQNVQLTASRSGRTGAASVTMIAYFVKLVSSPYIARRPFIKLRYLTHL
ncbi:hypothetical protein EYR38_006214 [Pleurotus pulmonarius]|nr:hypothetical protein EYR38_006214 [Pleurotus pulmonarius]